MMNNNEEKYYDDGRTIANMDVEGMPHRIKNEKNRQSQYDVSKQEKRQLVFAAYKAMIPVLICGIVGMTLAMLLIMLWLVAFK